jgi:hypothetical protein
MRTKHSLTACIDAQHADVSYLTELAVFKSLSDQVRPSVYYSVTYGMPDMADLFQVLIPDNLSSRLNELKHKRD